MKRFLFCQHTPPALTSTNRSVVVADVAAKSLLPLRKPRLMARSSFAILPCSLLWSLAVLSIPSATAQVPMPDATAIQIDSEVDDSEILLGESDEGRPPRPAPSDSKTSKTRWEENRELSVEPRTSQLLPDDAPAWVGSLPDLTDDVHRLFVGGHIAESPSEAAEGIDTPLVAAVNQYIDTHLLEREGAARALTGKVTADYIWKNLVDERTGYTARLNTPGQPMFQKWVTVSITPEQRAAILRWDREALQRDRLAPIGLGLVSLLGSVGLLHLILRRGTR